jgi:hypothetical protein
MCVTLLGMVGWVGLVCWFVGFIFSVVRPVRLVSWALRCQRSSFLFPVLFFALRLFVSYSECVIVLRVSPFPAHIDVCASLTGLDIP